MNVSRYFADVSNNNANFDAHTYAEHGHLVVAIKATEGLAFVDPDHRTWALRAGMVHIGVIHYHFARPDLGNSPEDEARFFLRNALHLTGGRDYLALDLERATPGGWQHDPSWSRAFDEFIQANSRFHTLLYATRSTLEGGQGWLKDDTGNLWVADWSSDPDVKLHGYSVLCRQYTDGQLGPEPHEFPGVGVCDGNVMRGEMFVRSLRQSHCG